MVGKYKYFSAGFIWMVLLLGCASTVPQSSDLLVNNYGYYKIYKKDKSFYVMQDGSIIYKHLKYVNPKVDKIYALDKNNKKRILKVKYKKISPAMDIPGECGNSEYLHTININHKADGVDVMAKVALTYSRKEIQNNIHIVSIPKEKADRVYFTDNTTSSKIEAETISNVYLYFQKGSKYGFLGKIDAYVENENFIYRFTKDSNTLLYESIKKIDYMDGHYLLKRGGLFGYYIRSDNRMIPLKYKSLEAFDFDAYWLARFELPDGRKGYVDRKGNEYYD